MNSTVKCTDCGALALPCLCGYNQMIKCSKDLEPCFFCGVGMVEKKYNRNRTKQPDELCKICGFDGEYASRSPEHWRESYEDYKKHCDHNGQVHPALLACAEILEQFHKREVRSQDTIEDKLLQWQACYAFLFRQMNDLLSAPKRESPQPDEKTKTIQNMRDNLILGNPAREKAFSAGYKAGALEAELEGFINGVVFMMSCRLPSSTTHDGANTLNELRAIGNEKIKWAEGEIAKINEIEGGES